MATHPAVHCSDCGFGIDAHPIGDDGLTHCPGEERGNPEDTYTCPVHLTPLPCRQHEGGPSD